MASGEFFSETAGNVGSGIGDFISGITTPLFGGETTQTVTTKPSDNKSNNLPLIIGIVSIVIVLAIVGYFIFRT